MMPSKCVLYEPWDIHFIQMSSISRTLDHSKPRTYINYLSFMYLELISHPSFVTSKVKDLSFFFWFIKIIISMTIIITFSFVSSSCFLYFFFVFSCVHVRREKYVYVIFTEKNNDDEMKTTIQPLSSSFKR